MGITIILDNITKKTPTNHNENLSGIIQWIYLMQSKTGYEVRKITHLIWGVYFYALTIEIHTF